MKIIWDRSKRLANIAKHGLDFATLTEDFFFSTFVRPARGGRFQAIGEDANGVISVVFAQYGVEGVSIISMRPARKDERKLFNAKKENG